MHPRTYSFAALLCLVAAGCWKDDKAADDSVDASGQGIEAMSRVKVTRRLAQMRKYLGVELNKLDGKEIDSLNTAIKALLPEHDLKLGWDYEPWRFWEFEGAIYQPQYVLFEARSSPHPGSTGIRISVLDSSPNPPSVFEFHTGYRCYLTDVTLEFGERFTYPLIVLETLGRGGPGPDYDKQYYAFDGNRFDLVRLVRLGPDGDRATRNDYAMKGSACGPAIPTQTDAEWEADLHSKDRRRVLRALVWLGGLHDSFAPNASRNSLREDLQDILLVRSVRQRERVIGRLRELAQSKDLWLREAAELALSPEKPAIAK
jgi:hypothetical protein